MLKILVSPNALKESLTATDAADAIAKGIVNSGIEATLHKLPIADGGDGMLEVLEHGLDAKKQQVEVSDPLGRPISANYLYSETKQIAVIEMAEAAGLRLLKSNEHAPLESTTQGVGELMIDALNRGANHIILGIGGSATTDAATGLASALGIEFLDKDGKLLRGCGESLIKIETINTTNADARLEEIKLDVICDVSNPLLGSNGAAAVYAPQKGANPAQVAQLEDGLAHFAKLLKKQYNKKNVDFPGAGAAGGLGAGLNIIFNAELKAGADFILDLLQVDDALNDVDLVITAEGKLDEQTSHGKAPSSIAKRAKKRNIPCVVIAGQVQGPLDDLCNNGVTAAFSLCNGPMSLADAKTHAPELLIQVSEQIMRLHFNQYSLPAYLKNKMKRQDIMIKKCLFPAAGYGTRFLPATKAMPKEILPVLDKPLIQYGVEEAMHANMREIAIITGRGKRALADHFDTNYELEHQISGTSKEALLTDIRKIIDECIFSYTRQSAMRGLGDAILCGETLIGNEAFGVILADDLCEGDQGDGVMQQMCRIYEKYRCSVIAIQEVDPEEVYKYGVIEGRELEDDVYVVSSMVEKPDPKDAPSNLAIIGRYILTPDIFSVLKRTPNGKNNELQLTDALETQAKENMVIAYKFKGKRFDCGSMDGFVEATNYFYDKQKK